MLDSISRARSKCTARRDLSLECCIIDFGLKRRTYIWSFKRAPLTGFSAPDLTSLCVRTYYIPVRSVFDNPGTSHASSATNAARRETLTNGYRDQDLRSGLSACLCGLPYQLRGHGLASIAQECNATLQLTFPICSASAAVGYLGSWSKRN